MLYVYINLNFVFMKPLLSSFIYERYSSSVCSVEELGVTFLCYLYCKLNVYKV